jgi:hypothetical protein
MSDAFALEKEKDKNKDKNKEYDSDRDDLREAAKAVFETEKSQSSNESIICTAASITVKRRRSMRVLTSSAR